MQGWFNSCLGYTPHGRLKDENHMMISIVAEKVLNRVQQPFMIKKKKTVNKLGREGMYFNIIKGVYDTSTANMILNDEKL